MGASISDDKRKSLEREFVSVGRRPTTKEFKDIAARVGVSETTARKVFFKGVAKARRSGGDSAERAERDVTPREDDPSSPAAPIPDTVEVRLQPVETPATSMPTLIASPPAAPPSPAPAPTSAGPAAPLPPSIAPLVNTVCTIFDSRATAFATLEAQKEADPNAPPPLPGAITPEERKALAEAWEAFVLKHPELFTQYLVEINVAIVTIGIFAPRLMAVWARANYERDRRDSRRRTEPSREAAPAPAHPLATAGDPAQDFREGDRFVSRLKGGV